MDLSLKHDAAFCQRENCEICKGFMKPMEARIVESHPDNRSGNSADTEGPLIDLDLGPEPVMPLRANRFDPYEALDQISDMAKDRVSVLRLVLALRAYITGMEK